MLAGRGGVGEWGRRQKSARRVARRAERGRHGLGIVKVDRLKQRCSIFSRSATTQHKNVKSNIGIYETREHGTQ